MKAYGRVEEQCIILDLGTGRSKLDSFRTRPLYTWGKGLLYKLDRRLTALQGRPGRCREEILPLSGIDPGSSRPWSLVNRLSYSDSHTYTQIFFIKPRIGQ
jgi:hypothetical protein